MTIEERIDELKKCLALSRSDNDWQQRITHPEAINDAGWPLENAWGTPDIIATNPESNKVEKIVRAYDSGNLALIISMRKHVEALITEIEQLKKKQ